jgi:hypothetical protein
MEPMRGVTEMAEFAGVAVTKLLPQPATKSSAGARSSEIVLKNSRMVTIPDRTSILSTFSAEKVKQTYQMSRFGRRAGQRKGRFSDGRMVDLAVGKKEKERQGAVVRDS